MLFLPPDQVDAAWATITTATRRASWASGPRSATGELAEHSVYARQGAPVHPCCVYTYDCRDTADVGRVLAAATPLPRLLAASVAALDLAGHVCDAVGLLATTHLPQR